MTEGIERSGYFGSKAASGLFQNIIALMPVHETYIATHLGGGAVMMRKPSAINNIGIDIDQVSIEKCAHKISDTRTQLGAALIYRHSLN